MPNDLLLAALRSGVTHVHFKKLDLTSRHMMATLNPDLMPPRNLDAPKNNRATHTRTDQVCVVWDTQAQAWRSFRWDSVQDWHVPEQAPTS
jgi:hypothetical protein